MLEGALCHIEEDKHCSASFSSDPERFEPFLHLQNTLLELPEIIEGEEDEIEKKESEGK